MRSHHRLLAAALICAQALTAMLAGGQTLAATTPTADAYQPASYQPDPALILETQYTAVWQQTVDRWQWLPLDGRDLDVAGEAHCADTATVPPGLWLLARDEQGRPELIAPSVTPLPPGQPDRIPLHRGCDADGADARALALPQVVFDWLANNVGAVRIDD